MSAILAYLARCGIEFDTAVNVLTGGQLGQTVSLRVAVADKNGGTAAHLVCKALDVLVQPNHCALQFTTDPSPWTVYVRAGVAFTVAIGAVVGLGYLVLRKL